MKISITTIREFSKEDYWEWAKSCASSINTISRLSGCGDRIKMNFFKRLKNDGKAIMEDRTEKTKVKTIYQIIDRR